MDGRGARIGVVSDVSVGYGSPQVQSLTQFLARYYGTQAMILEPDQSSKVGPRRDDPWYTVRRLSTTVSPYTRAGRIEYILKAAGVLNQTRPEILVLFCTFTLPVLLKLKYRPRLTIYDAMEMISAYGPFDMELNRHLACRLDIVIYPEENRASLDAARCGLTSVPTAIVYNAVNPRAAPALVPPAERRKALLYAGTIQTGRTLAEYFLREEIRQVAIDLFGNLEGPDQRELEAALLTRGGNVRYHGYIDGIRLGQLRKTYAFSLTMWAPTDENTIYAAPNKFFEAIADGVPPLTTPHPQCRLLINRYRCGIVMKDWSFGAFRAAVQEASATFGTETYARMVENCRTAVLKELNCEDQLAKLERLLPRTLS
jgi:hypothetical protein